MAADYIKITTTTSKQAEDFKTFVLVLTDAYRRGKIILGQMNHNFVSGPPTDFTALQTLFGVANPNGQTVFNLVNGTIGALEGTMTNNNAIELIERVG